MFTTKTNMAKPEAKLYVSNNELKSYDSVYYLNPGTKFEVLLNNPTPFRYLAYLEVNGVKSEQGLILEAGQRFMLKRHLHGNKRLVFETYEVPKENAKAAQQLNGSLRILFHKEQIPTNFIYRGLDITYTTGTPPITYYGTTNIGTNFNSTVSANYVINESGSESIGKIGEGEQTEQEFSTGTGNFSYYPDVTIDYKLLPVTQASIPIRNYCSSCGAKVQDKWKFCATCGDKL